MLEILNAFMVNMRINLCFRIAFLVKVRISATNMILKFELNKKCR